MSSLDESESICGNAFLDSTSLHVGLALVVSARRFCSLLFSVILSFLKYNAAFLGDSLCLSPISTIAFAFIIILLGQNTSSSDSCALRMTCADSANKFVNVVGAGLMTDASLLSSGSKNNNVVAYLLQRDYTARNVFAPLGELAQKYFVRLWL